MPGLVISMSNAWLVWIGGVHGGHNRYELKPVFSTHWMSQSKRQFKTLPRVETSRERPEITSLTSSRCGWGRSGYYRRKLTQWDGDQDVVDAYIGIIEDRKISGSQGRAACIHCSVSRFWWARLFTCWAPTRSEWILRGALMHGQQIQALLKRTCWCIRSFS